MIGKVSPRGSRVSGLLHYLFGPGRCEAHTDPHLIACWRHPAELEPPLRHDGHRDFRHLSGLLQQPHDALGDRRFDRPVWHCSVRAAPSDRMLSDDEWAQLACEIMHRTGLAPYGQEDEAVRWVAARHAPDHIHLVAMLARQDGTRPRLWNDYYRIGEACRAAEHRFGLRATAPRDRTAAHRPTRAESEKARRRGRGEPPRVTLRRTVATAAAASSSEREFFAHLDAAGVSVRKRWRSVPRAAPADIPTRSPDRGRHRPADCSAACRSSRRRPDCGRATICRTALVYGAVCQPRQGQNPRQPGHAGLPHLHTASARGSVSEGVPTRICCRKPSITRPGAAPTARSHPVTDLAGFTPRPRPA